MDINIFLLIENRILREALARMFRKRTDMNVVGHCQYSETAIEEICRSKSDVLLLGYPPAATSPADLVSEIAATSPKLRVILFGVEEDPEGFLRAVRSGIRGYLLKEASAVDLLAAVRAVVQGEAVCPPRLCLTLFQQFAAESRATARYPSHRLCRRLGLTRRQQQLAALVAMGLTNKEIASQLNLSEFTIKNHIHRLLKQVDAESRYEAIENIRASGFTLVN